MENEKKGGNKDYNIKKQKLYFEKRFSNMKLTKKIFSLFLGILIFITGIPNVFAANYNEVNIAVIAYSEEIRERVCNSISPSGNSIIGSSPVDNKYYKINFVKLPPYPAYCDDNELRRYISDNESIINKCCGCMFIYDLSKVYDFYNGPLLETWKMRENGYGNEVKEECRRWCHAIEKINPERYFLFIPDASRLRDSDLRYWCNYACDNICSCENSWMESHPGHPQFVCALIFPQRSNDICSNLLHYIPIHNHARGVGDMIYRHPVVSVGVGALAVGALCGIGYGIYKGGEYLLNKAANSNKK